MKKRYIKPDSLSDEISVLKPMLDRYSQAGVFLRLKDARILPKQANLAKLLLERMMNTNDTRSDKELLKDAGYSPSAARSPGRAIGSTGVQKAMQIYGADVDTAAAKMGKIVQNEEHAKHYNALEFVLKTGLAKEDQTHDLHKLALSKADKDQLDSLLNAVPVEAIDIEERQIVEL